MISSAFGVCAASVQSVRQRLVRSPTAGRYALLVIGCCCQFATILITWPLWQPRHWPPNLPIAGFESLPFGWLLILTLVVVLLRPPVGAVLHLLTLAFACVSDQFRMQPQFFGLSVLILICSSDFGLRMGRWVVASTWLWAGIHKLLSPDWMGHSAWSLLAQAGMDPTDLYVPFSLVVALSEVSLGIAALLRLAGAAWLCVILHLGIVIFLSPLVVGTNSSVIPWNLGLALIGPWMLLRSSEESAVGVAEYAVRIISLVMPIGFYFGCVDRSMAAVLYSGCIPRGLITHQDGLERVRGWGDVGVPFPSERHLIQQYFESTARPGDKLHVLDPRPMLNDQYFVLAGNHHAVELTVAEFFDFQPQQVAGIALDNPRSIFTLSLAGARMLKDTNDSMIYAIDFQTSDFDPKLLAELSGLPNLQQVQLAGTSIENDDLRHVKSLRLLTGIGLDDTRVTDSGLAHLQSLPYLQNIEYERTSITAAAVRSIIEHTNLPSSAQGYRSKSP